MALTATMIQYHIPDPLRLAQFLAQTFYPRPNVNIFLNEPWLLDNAYATLYVMIGLSFLLVILVDAARGRFDKQTLRNTLILICALYAVILSGLQFLGRWAYFAPPLRAMAGHSLTEKNTVLGGKAFAYAQWSRQIMPSACRAYFMTDLDTSQDPGMLSHRKLALYLYPIHIRHETPLEDCDCLVVYSMPSFDVRPFQDDFQFYRFSPDSVLGVRKKE